jgi:hypothetical protein
MDTTNRTEISPYLVSSENNDSNKMSYFTTEIIIIVIVVVILIIIIYYMSDSSSNFLNPGYRSDKQIDDSYLEDQIEFLNKMQDRNLSKM